jgi:two-component system response regulator MprA
MVLQAKVLVVDDEESLRASIGRILKFHGFWVEAAGDLGEALAKISVEQFDVVLTDLRMSGPEDGLRVIEAVREQYPEAITFLMSAYPNPAGTTASLKLRSDEIVAKPIDIPGLIRRIRERLEDRMGGSGLVEG